VQSGKINLAHAKVLITMNIPKFTHIGIDEWKLEQIVHLYESGFSANEIADQVDVEEKIVVQVIELLKK
jgi:hypothetical protein